jgi:hypothetical protein
MDILMKSELGFQDQDPQVLWEEDLKPKTTIIDSLISLSKLIQSESKKIMYIKRVSSGSQPHIYGAHVFDKEWRLKNLFPSQRRQQLPGRSQLEIQTESQTDTDVDDDSMLETEGSLGEQAFVQAGTKRTKSAGATEEKSWERLFRAVYYHMHELLKKQIQECNTGGSQQSESQQSGSQQSGSQQQCSDMLPFTELPDRRYWSSEFAINPIPDATDLRKPNLVLLDYSLRKLAYTEKSWKNVLTGVEITHSDISANHKYPCFWGLLLRATI